MNKDVYINEVLVEYVTVDLIYICMPMMLNFSSILKIEFDSQILQDDLTKLKQWMDVWLLRFNVAICNCVIEENLYNHIVTQYQMKRCTNLTV